MAGHLPRRGSAPRYIAAISLLICVADTQAATYFVTTSADSGPGSLREAVTQANAHPNSDAAPDFIQISDLVQEPISLRSGEIVITDSVFIGSITLSQVAISADHHRIFRIEPPVNAANLLEVNLSRLRFINGYSTESGGAIVARKTNLTLWGSAFTLNRAGYSGGALDVSQAQTLQLSHTTFWDNAADVSGGALHVTDVDTVNGASLAFGENFCQTRGGAAAIDANTTTFSESVFAYNRVTGGGRGPIESSGAGLSVRGAYLTVEKSRFTGNFNQADHGGALAVEPKVDEPDIPITAHIGDTVFQRNVAHGAGGAIYGNTANVDSVRSLFHKNESSRDGGAIAFTDVGQLRIWHSTFHQNLTLRDGGALVTGPNTTLLLAGTTVAYNTDEAGAAIIHRGSDPAVVRNSVLFGATNADIAGTFATEYSLVGNPAGATVIAGDGNLPDGLDPQLGPLADLGGRTLVMLPLPGSVLLDAAGALASGDGDKDQRGAPRLVGPRPDIGAAERQAFEDILFRDRFED
ncbi:choice-of-anchor Q domain-containing protein [Tahibacter amnicola]|uniref:Outer membrane repeat protein n=1 Tax=Tahibacter amnicola TaxID=2976241 RepID=A0ABY6BGR1_9GAMM|nr:choice-of-anchor Q domain-containing protein [Tahibacter amnicola]UXI69030.1 hypothetical protein N4264_05080 [Tahibacter amnicola]